MVHEAKTELVSSGKSMSLTKVLSRIPLFLDGTSGEN